MSIGALGLLGSVTSGQLQQTRGADTDRAGQDARTQNNQAESARHAEAAQGVGEMVQDESTTDRDADGRRLWERVAKREADSDSDRTPQVDSPQSVDPSGQAGNQLDLTG